MATAPTPLRAIQQEREMLNARHAVIAKPSELAGKRTMSPVLIAMLVALAIYPFVVGFLPVLVRQYLGSLFR